MSKLYVGNLSWGTTDDSLREGFEKFGGVIEASVVRDRETGRSRGFGFVTFVDETSATAAIDGFKDQEFEGRNIKVDRASERDNSGRNNRRGGYQSQPGRSDGSWIRN